MGFGMSARAYATATAAMETTLVFGGASACATPSVAAK